VVASELTGILSGMAAFLPCFIKLQFALILHDFFDLFSTDVLLKRRRVEERSPCGIQGVWSRSPTGVFYSSTTRPMLPNSGFHGASLRLEAKGLLKKTRETGGNIIGNLMKILDLVYDLVYELVYHFV
jgi:hypothetical protein